MSCGFIYVLVNSSMPGLVKIGKTTRRPSDRVRELSGVTGVPTPFVVAYEEYFADCDEAEKYLHSNLSNSGIRVSESREFFRASATDIVKMIAAMPLAFSRGRRPSFGRNDMWKPDGRESFRPDSDFAALLEKQSEGRKKYKWLDLYRRADSYRFGWVKGYDADPDKVEPDKAFDLYLEAANSGSARAFRSLGEMCLDSEGDIARPDAAIGYFVQGAKLGDYRCRLFIAYALLEQGELAKGRSEINLFLKEIEQDLGYKDGGVSGSHNSEIYLCLKRATLNDSIPSEDKTKFFLDFEEFWPRIEEEATSSIEYSYSKESPGAIAARGVLKVIKLLREAPSNVACQLR